LDSLSLALEKVASGVVPEPSMSTDQALSLLLQAVDQLAQKMAVSLSGAYVNSLLLKCDALLKRSSLQSAFKSSLLAVPISPHFLFCPCVKAAVEESGKRMTDEAFAAFGGFPPMTCSGLFTRSGRSIAAGRKPLESSRGADGFTCND
jgi:hypothetical protein